MYTREEKILEENLDWHKKFEKKDHSEEIPDGMESKKIIHPDTEQSGVVLQKKMNLSQISIKKLVLNILQEYGGVTFFLGTLVLPYIIGFIVVSIILLNGNVPIDRFFSLKDGIFHFELWSIGAYISITVGVIWLVIMLFLYRK